MDIVITTPKTEMANVAREAEDCIRAGGGFYFRRLTRADRPRPHVEPGDRVFCAEDGHLRGYAIVSGVELIAEFNCLTTGRDWPPGWYAIMNAETWQWIRPIPMRGFQGYRFLHYCMYRKRHLSEWIERMGGWLDPKPAVLSDRPTELAS